MLTCVWFCNGNCYCTKIIHDLISLLHQLFMLLCTFRRLLQHRQAADRCWSQSKCCQYFRGYTPTLCCKR